MTRLTGDRKSTRLNSSHPSISYAVFCLKKKTQKRALLSLDKRRTSRTAIRLQTRVARLLCALLRCALCVPHSRYIFYCVIFFFKRTGPPLFPPFSPPPPSPI